MLEKSKKIFQGILMEGNTAVCNELIKRFEAVLAAIIQ